MRRRRRLIEPKHRFVKAIVVSALAAAAPRVTVAEPATKDRQAAEPLISSLSDVSAAAAAIAGCETPHGVKLPLLPVQLMAAYLSAAQNDDSACRVPAALRAAVSEVRALARICSADSSSSPSTVDDVVATALGGLESLEDAPPAPAPADRIEAARTSGRRALAVIRETMPPNLPALQNVVSSIEPHLAVGSAIPGRTAVDTLRGEIRAASYFAPPSIRGDWIELLHWVGTVLDRAAGEHRQCGTETLERVRGLRRAVLPVLQTTVAASGSPSVTELDLDERLLGLAVARTEPTAHVPRNGSSLTDDPAETSEGEDLEDPADE